MKTSTTQSGLFAPRVLLAFILCSVGVFLAALGFATTPTPAGWSIVTSPSTGSSRSVTCVSASDCWAVGGNIQHWDGASWTIVTSPAAATSVACASASECWAVGSYNNETLIERWDGTSWAIITSPNSGTLSNALYGVTCASASDCWAVGISTYSDNGFPFPGSYSQPLIEHWNGAAWTVVSSPNPPPNVSISSLAAVTCASASDCWAIASFGQIIEHWDGNSWTFVSQDKQPNFGENYSFLPGVTCASASDCWAVGYYYDPTSEEVNYPIIEHWNGNTWALVPSANAGALAGVTCVSASDCWAVGNIHFQHWDGTSWSAVASPNPSDNTSSDHLDSLACASASECWAVGYRNPGGALIEKYSPTIPPLTNIVSRKIHGSAGTFDVDLLNTSPAIECRNPGATGIDGVDYKIVFSFVNNVTNCGSASTGFLSSGPGPNQCTVNLLAIANQQSATVTLSNVLDSQNNTGIVAATMGVLIGDTNADGFVNSGDIAQTKSRSGQAVGSTNFRSDVTIDGTLNSGDIGLVKSKSGTALP